MAPPPNPSDANSNNDDPFGGMDPMAWLELLAKRQGANLDELTTAANIDVPMPSADTVVTGPGYTPGYDTGKPKETPNPPTPQKPPHRLYRRRHLPSHLCSKRSRSRFSPPPVMIRSAAWTRWPG